MWGFGVLVSPVRVNVSSPCCFSSVHDPNCIPLLTDCLSSLCLGHLFPAQHELVWTSAAVFWLIPCGLFFTKQPKLSLPLCCSEPSCGCHPTEDIIQSLSLGVEYPKNSHYSQVFKQADRLWCLKHTKIVPASGPLHLMHPQPGWLYSYTFTWFTPPLNSGVCSIGTYSGIYSPTTLSLSDLLKHLRLSDIILYLFVTLLLASFCNKMEAPWILSQCLAACLALRRCTVNLCWMNE